LIPARRAKRVLIRFKSERAHVAVASTSTSNSSLTSEDLNERTASAATLFALFSIRVGPLPSEAFFSFTRSSSCSTQNNRISV